MYQEERMMMILRHLKKHHRISVQEICGMFGVSRDTARRDLVKLSEQNAIIRTRGGAILPVLEKEVDSYKKRVGQKSEAKAKIGRLAAATIQPRDPPPFAGVPGEQVFDGRRGNHQRRDFCQG